MCDSPEVVGWLAGKTCVHGRSILTSRSAIILTVNLLPCCLLLLLLVSCCLCRRAALYCVCVQVSHRHAVLSNMRGGSSQVPAVRLPDLHAANLFLQVGVLWRCVVVWWCCQSAAE